jgi:hypothetical protein
MGISTPQHPANRRLENGVVVELAAIDVILLNDRQSVAEIVPDD